MGDGQWHYRARASQLLTFDGLRWGTKTPTDFDIVVDFGGAMAVGELKYLDTPVPQGQELALERAVDGWHDAGMSALAFVASHDAPVGQDIMVAEATVIKVRWAKVWRPELGTVRTLLDRFYEFTLGRGRWAS